MTKSAPGIMSSKFPTLKLFCVALTKDGLLDLIEDSLNAKEISNPESRIFNPWCNPWEPQPTITIFLSFKNETPSLNSEESINLHFPSWISFSSGDNLLK